MFTFTIKDTKELDRFRRAFPSLASRAVNTAARGSVEVARRTILDNYNVPAEAVDRAIKSIPSGAITGRIRARIIASGRMLTARYFKPVQTPAGTSFEIRKGVRRLVPHAFIADVVRGGRRGRAKMRRAIKGTVAAQTRLIASALDLSRAGVWIRRGSARLPIREVAGASVANMFSSGIVTKALRTFNAKAIPKALTDEINDYMARRA